MKRNTILKKVTVLAIFFAVFSLTFSVVAFNQSSSSQGVGVSNREVWNVHVDNLSTIASDTMNVVVLNEPELMDNKIVYGINLNRVSGYGQFIFNIFNEGTVDAKVKNIKVTGIDDYKDYIDVSFKNLNIGDVIGKGKLLSNIKVITTYKNGLYNDDMSVKNIELNDIGIEIEFERVG